MLEELKWKFIKLLSKPNINIKKNYKLVRIFETIRHYSPLKSSNSIDYMCYYDNHNIEVRVYTPVNKKEDYTILFFHGGGFVAGDIDSYDEFCSTMCSKIGAYLVSVNYRLAPEHPFPCGLEDCYFVYNTLINNPSFFGLKKQNIILLGDSAGGNLCASLSLLLRDKKQKLPFAQILLYPCLNYDYSINSPFSSVKANGKDYMLTSTHMEEYISLYKRELKDLKSPYLAPLNTKKYRKQPCTFIVTAEFDPLRDEAEEYGRRLKKARNKVCIHRVFNVCHGFFVDNPNSIESEEIILLIKQFLGSDNFEKNKLDEIR